MDKNSSLENEPGDQEQKPEDAAAEEFLPGQNRRYRRRRKVKVRRRVRVKKKTSSQKKFRRLMEIAAWLIVIGLFIFALTMLISQIDNDSKHSPKKKTSIYPVLQQNNA